MPVPIRVYGRALQGAAIAACVGLISCAAATDQTDTPAGKPPHTLEGTAWQLVVFRGSDETTLTPDNRSKYTIEFGPGGKLTARIDCNRGVGTWKSSGPNMLEFGPLGLTLVQCPPGSLHDQIVEQWSNIRTYVLRGGHLFLALMADGGIYEFEPLTKPPR